MKSKIIAFTLSVICGTATCFLGLEIMNFVSRYGEIRVFGIMLCILYTIFVLYPDFKKLIDKKIKK